MAKNKINRHSPVRVIERGSRYLLQVADGMFYFRMSGEGRPLGVRAPSMAAHMSYAEADALCQKLRSEGYTGPVVTDIYGRVADVDTLAAERIAQAERVRRFWGDLGM